jgi:hypothetical protein
MSTPLIILAGILAVFTFILIPLMMYRGGKQHQVQHPASAQHKKHCKKRRKR